MTAAPVESSDYMHFAKTGAGALYNLATSGVADCTLADLDVNLNALSLHGPNVYGFPPLVECVAARLAVDPGCVVMPGGGCSFANHLAMAAVLQAGDEVLVEDPTYELLLATLGYLGARVRRFARRHQDRYSLDVGAVVAGLTASTRLVVLTNLHNPTGAHSDVAQVHAVAAAASKVGAMVLVDEVYLELLANGAGAPTAFHPDGNIITTGSLTKAYGLSGLRCGWVLAPASLAERMRRLNDLFGVQPPHIAERVSVLAFDRLAGLRTRAGGMIATNRAAYLEILGHHPALDQTILDQGTTMFPRLRSGDGDSLFQRVTADFDTSVVPGRFFGRPDHIRVGLGGDPAMTRVGLERLGTALRV